jgi:hypothetical protein
MIILPVDTVSSCDDPLLAYESPATGDSLREEALLDDRGLKGS